MLKNPAAFSLMKKGGVGGAELTSCQGSWEGRRALLRKISANYGEGHWLPQAPHVLVLQCEMLNIRKEDYNLERTVKCAGKRDGSWGTTWVLVHNVLLKNIILFYLLYSSHYYLQFSYLTTLFLVHSIITFLKIQWFLVYSQLVVQLLTVHFRTLLSP